MQYSAPLRNRAIPEAKGYCMTRLSHQATLQLIEAVRRNEHLWDQEDKFYGNYDYALASWNTIITELFFAGSTDADCALNTWSNLLYSYFNHLKRPVELSKNDMEYLMEMDKFISKVEEYKPILPITQQDFYCLPIVKRYFVQQTYHPLPHPPQHPAQYQVPQTIQPKVRAQAQPTHPEYSVQSLKIPPPPQPYKAIPVQPSTVPVQFVEVQPKPQAPSVPARTRFYSAVPVKKQVVPTIPDRAAVSAELPALISRVMVEQDNTTKLDECKQSEQVEKTYEDRRERMIALLARNANARKEEKNITNASSAEMPESKYDAAFELTEIDPSALVKPTVQERIFINMKTLKRILAEEKAKIDSRKTNESTEVTPAKPESTPELTTVTQKPQQIIHETELRLSTDETAVQKQPKQDSLENADESTIYMMISFLTMAMLLAMLLVHLFISLIE